jgi:ribosome-associated protein
MSSIAASSSRVNASRPAPDARVLADRAAELALEKQATDVVVLDLRKTAAVCDYFVIASAASEPQVAAVAERVEEGLREAGETPWHVEGLRGRTWVLIDYVDVVVHVFHARTREIYTLERLWGDAPQEKKEDGIGDS